MSTQPEANPPESDGLQFDQAEFDGAPATTMVACAACRRPITDEYYEINGATLCDPCRVQIEGQLRGGSGFFRLIKATIFGSGAAIAGAAVYFAVLYFLNIQAALASILCGFLIGKAVRKGSEGRGGWIYQILAVILTYLAIGLAYSSDLLADGQITAQIEENLANDPQGAMVDDTKKMLLTGVVFLFYSVASPVIVSTSNIISAVIIVFALWEAWKFTKKAKLVVTGPYRIGETEPDFGAPGVSDHG